MVELLSDSLTVAEALIRKLELEVEWLTMEKKEIKEAQNTKDGEVSVATSLKDNLPTRIRFNVSSFISNGNCTGCCVAVSSARGPEQNEAVEGVP